MLQIQILSGASAGTHCVARRFPFRIGRARNADLSIQGDGVWDQHLQIRVDEPGRSFLLAASPDATAYINGQPVSTASLRNGDVVTIGAVQLQCLLSVVQQRNLRVREALFWIFLAALTLVEIAAFYWLQG